MNDSAYQLDLFKSTSLNPAYEIKRQIRIALGNSSLSRDEVADRMNEIAVAEGIRKKITRAQIDNWAKDSDPDRLPSPPWLTILCKVLGNIGPIEAMIRPLGFNAIGPEETRVLRWGHADLAKRRAAKKARLALEAIE